MRSFKLSYIAEVIGGNLIGEDLEVKNVASLNNAKEGDITFLFQKQYREAARTSEATAIVVTEGLQLEGKNCIVVKNGALAQAKLLKLFYPSKRGSGKKSERAFVAASVVFNGSVTVMDFAYIDENSTIGDGTIVYPFVYIGKNVTIGKNVLCLPHVVIMDDAVIGDDVILYPGAVIGADGFGYAFSGQEYIKIPQVGRVVIENNVEIGANTTVDRATLEETRIGEGTKIDNLVMVGHNVTIGKHSAFAAQVGIAGSTKVGDYVVMAGKVGVKDHVNIGDGVQIGGMSGIIGDIEKGSKVAGIPAMNYVKWLKTQAIIEKLPEMKKEIDALKKLINKEEEK